MLWSLSIVFMSILHCNCNIALNGSTRLVNTTHGVRYFVLRFALLWSGLISLGLLHYLPHQWHDMIWYGPSVVFIRREGHVCCQCTHPNDAPNQINHVKSILDSISIDQKHQGRNEGKSNFEAHHEVADIGSWTPPLDFIRNGMICCARSSMRVWTLAIISQTQTR